MTARGPVVLAVDFGTTNTVGVARWGHGPPHRVTVDGDPSMPSAVLLGNDGKLVVGRDAVRLGRAAPARLELRPKSRLDEGTLLLGDRTVDVLDAVRAVLRTLCAEVTAAAGAPVGHLVLTHPADWGAARLGRFAGVATGMAATTSLVPEPVAAAAHAGMAPGTTRAVLDLGGGTCDAAVVRALDPAPGYAVLACAGLPDLGGDDLDQRIVDFVLARCPSAARLAATSSTSDIQALRDRLLLRQDARAAKELLSRHDTARVAVPGVAEPVEVRREDFERIVAADLDRAATLLRDVIAAAGTTPGAVGEVLLVGGSSRVPALGELVRRRLGTSVALAREPESAVAGGALAVTGAEQPTAPHPVVLTETPASAPVPPPPGRKRTRLAVVATVVVVAVAAVLATILTTSQGTDDVTGSPGGSSAPAEPTAGTPVTGPAAPPPRIVPKGQYGRLRTEQLELDLKLRADSVAASTAVPAPRGYRWVRADVTVTLLSGFHDLAEPTPMRLVDDRGQRITPLRAGPAVDAGGCTAPLPSLAVGESRSECQLFLVPDATPIAGVMYDDFSGDEVNRGGLVLSAPLPATGSTDLPGVVGEVGGPAGEVDLASGRFELRVDEVVESPSAYLTGDSEPMNGGRYVVVRLTVTAGDTPFRAEDHTAIRLVDDRGLVVPEEQLTHAELVDCPAGREVPPGETATACVVLTAGERTPIAGVTQVGAADDVATWRTWRLTG